MSRIPSAIALSVQNAASHLPNTAKMNMRLIARVRLSRSAHIQDHGFKRLTGQMVVS